MEPLDFVAIGDTTSDAFIRIKDASATCDVDHHNCKLCLRFGDKVPYESVEIVKAVGNSANAAVAAARLGLRAALIADVGGDQNGKEAIETLAGNKVSTEFVRAHDGMETNYHYVLWYEEERTILVKHQAYPYKMPDGVKARWVYFSSVGEQSLPYHEEITQWLIAHPETKFAFQPGTFQIKLGAEKLKKLYARCDIFICNLEESQTILGSASSDPKILLAGLRALGPKTAVITAVSRSKAAF